MDGHDLSNSDDDYINWPTSTRAPLLPLAPASDQSLSLSTFGKPALTMVTMVMMVMMVVMVVMMEVMVTMVTMTLV